MTRFRPLLDKFGINEQQWRVIRVLAEHESLDASDLADRANILAPSLTRMIRSMDERGLIRRGKDQGDGRRVLLSITAKGRALIEAVAPDTTRIYAELDAEFGEKRMAALLTLLDELAGLRNP